MYVCINQYIFSCKINDPEQGPCFKSFYLIWGEIFARGRHSAIDVFGK